MSADTELFLIDESVLKGRVIPAISDFLDRSDPAAARQLVQETISGHQFQVALQSDINAERTIAEHFANGSIDLLDGKLPNEILDDTGDMIRDREAIRRRQTERILSPFLVFYLCAWSRDAVPTSVSLNRNRLTDYLRSKSPWMEELLGSSNEFLWKAPDLPLAIGGEAKLLTKEEASTLLGKLLEIPSPSQGQELNNQYETLKRLLEIAEQEPRFRVLIRTM